MSIASGSIDAQETEHLPPKKHIFYSNGLLLIIGALLVITSWNINERPWNLLGVSMPIMTPTVTLCCLILIVLYTIDGAYSYFYEKDDTNMNQKLSYIVPLNWKEYRHFMFIAFAAGICEEIVFRGFLINYLVEVMKPFGLQTELIILLPSLVFAVSHYYQGFWSVVKIFAIAILFSLIFIYSKSLLLVVALHVSIDLLSGMLTVVTAKKT